MSDDTIILRPYMPNDAEWLAARHGALYAQQEGFDDTFALLVAQILTDFAETHDPKVERGWVAQRGTERLGSIFCVRLDKKTAKLRLFLLEPAARGQGLGQHLLETCLDFARDVGYDRLTLWTHQSHHAACALYRKNGFACIEEKPVHSFGRDLVEQTWTISL
ncbi:GNAT family N-acetyltransferase [Litoreibacter roseus]|uniref:N-acetyltransferase n=1 Tax=Litoreibacter roseus TaxID=2601869 RepID=A0A6N6JDR2_9RHOB|nr:GNAT family N-acetyltransferase [Litoreibacter roseus]GFE63519.1 N-acetyltransferase [Litoreibacter roseus]